MRPSAAFLFPPLENSPEPPLHERLSRSLLTPPAHTRRRRWWLWLIALVLAAAACYYGYQRFAAAPAKPDPAPVAAEKGGFAKGAKGAGKGGFDPSQRVTTVAAVPVARGAINITLNGLGTVTPLRTVVVKSRVDGQLMRVHFQEGQAVREGQLLAEIDPRPFEVALAQAEGQLARDQASLANARIDLERYRTLFAQDSIARQQVDTQEALVRQLEGTLRLNQAQVDNARLQLSYSRITAPIGGRVGLRQVDPGNIVRAGDTTGLVVITQLQPVAVVFTIPQDNLPLVLARQKAGARIPIEVFDREQKAKLASGRLVSIDNQIDPATGTVRLKAEFANADAALFPSQFVNARMQADVRGDALLIPTAAVQRGAQGSFVYVVKDDRSVTLRPVKTGPVDNDKVAIEDGLALGELVVTDGVDRLREGARVALPDEARRGGAGPAGGGKGDGTKRREAP